MTFINRTPHDVSYAGDYASEQDRQEQVRKKVGLSKTNRKPDKGNNGNCHNSRCNEDDLSNQGQGQGLSSKGEWNNLVVI